MMFKNKSKIVLVAIFCMVAVCTSFLACSKNEGNANASTGTESSFSSSNTSKKKVKKAKLPTKPNAEEDFIVTLTNDNEGAQVTGYLGNGGGVYIPATIQGLPVKRVDMEIPRTAGVTSLVVSDGCEYVRVFSDKDEYGERTILEITNISLPDTVETYNLRNTMITEFEVPANAKRVGRLPITLEKITFRGVPEGIYEGALEGTQITNIELPEGMKYIENEAFINCEMLTSVILPNTITRIGEYKGDANVFANCIALKSINLPVSLELIGVGSFMNCTNLKELVIPESLTSIRNIYIKAFKGCSNLPLATQAKLKQLGYRDTF